MKVIKAVTLSLGDLDKVVISEYQLGLIVNKIYKNKFYKGEEINLQKEFAEKIDLTKYLKLLLGESILSPYKNLKGIFTLIGKANQDTEVVRGRPIRVSTIGRTFLEMLKNPELCGEINHVLDVFEEYGEKHIRLITDDIDKNGTPIIKVRAGYILDELLNVKSEVIEKWSSFAQRGGSRKLDPKSEYILECL